MNVGEAKGPSLRGFRPVLIGCLGLAVAFAGLLALAGATSQAAGGKYFQSRCAGNVKQVRNAKNARQRRAAQARLARCRTNLRVYNLVKNSRFVGVRADGEPIDITLCANGKSADDAGSQFEDVYRLGWKITGARIVQGKYYVADFKAKLGGGGERVGSLKRSGRGFMVGIDRSLGDGDPEFGPAKKTDATRTCRTL